MAYADYEFYQNTYYGIVISEDAFERLESKASDKLDYLSNYRVPRYLESIVTEDERDVVLKKLIGKATCWLAEAIMDIESIQTAQRLSLQIDDSGLGMHSNVITNLSTGSESVTYQKIDSNTSKLSQYIDSPRALNKYLFNGVREYLGGSGLLSQMY